ncbi:ABC transporter permease/M1 family aminopeptidase [Sphingomonas sp. Leaf343]|uniref:ABC transporter permease/M1 family aminopeptidase n=1 Tax=Sphingomonas sp. Leaf343 TaxID=1736345 RepID=UPI0006F7166A|nr:M1 family aminopeptidase [Sphingomonas sp. Leaf343]KQR81367.1 aminopeptidase [Sphingomonas sp. Leaf343]
MFNKIARFELRYQLTGPVFLSMTALFFALSFGSVAIDQLQLAGGGQVHRNAGPSIARSYAILTLFLMFVTTAFVANVVIRDDETGFWPIVRSTRIRKFDYVIGRFTGAFAAAMIASLMIPLGGWLGSQMPWVDPDVIGPTIPLHYIGGYCVVMLPSLFATAAVFFAVATTTRSMLYSYLGVIVFLVAYFALLGLVANRPPLAAALSYVEPFGMVAVDRTTRFWTAAQSNIRTPVFAEALLVNRAIWTGIGVLALSFAYLRFDFARNGPSERRAPRRTGKAATSAKLPLIVKRLPPARPDVAGWSRLFERSRFEMLMVLRSPAFLILVLLGVLNAGAAALTAGEMHGMPPRPLTFNMIGVLRNTFGIIPLIIAIYYAGELVWRDRQNRIDEIIDATSLPNWAYMVPKTLAVTTVLLASLLASIVPVALIQLIRGGGDFVVGEYVAWYLLPKTVDMVILAILAVFVQALSPGKYVGWAIMVGYLVLNFALEGLGLTYPLYRYGATLPLQLSDMNGDQIGGPGSWWLRLYWGAFAGALAVLAHLLWRRGTDVRLASRLRRVPARLRGIPGMILVACGIVAGASGAWIHRNIDVLNRQPPQAEVERDMADFERRYGRYHAVAQPSLTTVRLAIDLHPRERRMVTRGRYGFVNDTGAPVASLYLTGLTADYDIAQASVPGATLVLNDPRLHMKIFRFATPLAPGATGELRFVTVRAQRGFRANGEDISLVRNGTSVLSHAFLPQFGINPIRYVEDWKARKRLGLPPLPPMAPLGDRPSMGRNSFGGAVWVMSDITITTDATQVAVAPGRRIAERVANGRRTTRYASTAPILSFFSVQSADYAVARRQSGSIALEVYHHPKHRYNVELMLRAMQATLAYGQRAFGPYQFDHARVVEFPGYTPGAVAFAGTVPVSEAMGFIADTRDRRRVDFVTYVMAHEMAHQYWGHQLAAADQKGASMLIETMAQYTALMVMKQLHGEGEVRRFLKYEMDEYLVGRARDTGIEPPLDRVERQSHIYYNKGAVAMYLLQDRLGEDRVNAMLRGIVASRRFKGAPYPNSLLLANGLRRLARTRAERELVDDLTDRVTLWDLRTTLAKTRPVGNGRWETVLTIAASKSHLDPKGVERPAALADTIEVGLFTAPPDAAGFSARNILVIRRIPVHTGLQQVTFVTTGMPTFGGVDPYTKYIDRDGADNAVEVRQ